MSAPLLVTGFGPFEKITANPSEALARACGREHEVLPVSYAGAIKFLEELDASSFSILLMIGVHGRAANLRVETTARNHFDGRADVDGFVPNSDKIRTHGPAAISGTLWPLMQLADFMRDHGAEISDDAGGYLCNFVYYEALWRFPQKRIGFLHVPPPELMDLDKQQRAVDNLIRRIEAS